jgi:hypothetical protein
MALNTLCTFLVHVLGQVHVLTGFRAAVHRLLTVQLVRKDAKVSSYVNLDKVADTEKIAEAIRVVRRLCQEVPPVRTLLMRVGNTIPAHPLIFRHYFIGTKAKGDISDENMELLNKPSREMLRVWRAGLLAWSRLTTNQFAHPWMARFSRCNVRACTPLVPYHTSGV